MDDRLALRLSYDLAGVTDRGAYLDAMNQSLGEVFRTDSQGWAGTHLSTRVAEIRGTNGSDRPEIAEALSRVMAQHPMYLSYLTPPGTMTPRRMSDLIPDRVWRSHPVFSELFIPMGVTAQLTIVVEPASVEEWSGWAFHRAGIDFTENEVETAVQLQPLLVTFNRLSSFVREAAPSDHRHLTDREVQVLQLVAQGFTAQNISYILRISPLTVRKHLEHTYEKLGEHNRLRAVRLAARDGIISL